jgi:predicted dehydrogenase
VRRALEAGKHVLVEKPLATSVAEAEELIEIAAQANRVLMPGHTFLYSPPVNKVRELIRSGELGDVYFITSSRMNLGLYQADGVISDLAPHDLSILLYWLGRPVTQIAASAQSIFQHGVPETAFLTLTFAGGATANVQISWLAPRKVRQMVVVGSKRMVQYEDTSSDESVRIYDRGLDVSLAEAPATFGEYQLTYRSGDIVVPRIEAAEPLGLELADFAHAIRTREEPRSCSALGLEIVRALEAAHISMNRAGEPVELARDEQPLEAAPALGEEARLGAGPAALGATTSAGGDSPQAAILG